MGVGDKAEHKAEEVGGHIKEGVGKLTGDEDLERQGRDDQAKANVKQAADNVGDAASSAFKKD
jgi:uncharacterized protein YjbJ (UPF0337 family)